ncbi:hypothetical protein IC744_06725 [Microbacterium hominis]|uniref:hypothetical protein n=1 Tax=Microbacterium TaxID=33882 RepID=UPI00168B0A50|nr:MULTISPECIES: hypothetical protein [Microbacterium]QOC26044.1 hypothetical protein IC745_01045 [Microbacterium hominis]QOC30015.1 hypothetical protein IC744_06725 [Microbacterium hominis]QYF98451.1 hypothetical protein KY498_04190 [Microbacterium sp. PAMC21962]
MPDPILIHDDLELYLIRRFRELLSSRPEPVCSDVKVDRVEPSGESSSWPARVLIIRDDGTTDLELHTGEASVGFTVLAGTKKSPKEAKDLAAIVRGLIDELPSADPSNPVAAVTSRFGPVMVAENQDRARVYITATLRVVARAH